MYIVRSSRMDFETKQALARTGHSDLMASAVRIKAARLCIGQSQEELGGHAGVKKAAINNVEKGRSYPGRSLMLYLFREHRIDFNFLILGHFVQLPGDVQDRLFGALEVVNSEWDQEANSS